MVATLLNGNRTSLEDKQNGGWLADRLAPVAGGKPLLLTQHKACGGSNAPETVGPVIYSWACVLLLDMTESEHMHLDIN